MPEVQIFESERGLHQDSWQRLADDSALPEKPGAVIVSLARWNRDRVTLLQSGHRLGLSLQNEIDVLSLTGQLADVALIALHFPAFTDGRAYSQARLLRERLNFSGQIRACGDVHREQLLYLSRCGFDEFEVVWDADEKCLRQALEEFSYAYQTTGSGPVLRKAG